jgi:ethanolamine utilization protein EutP (predicted NTPase)
MPIKYAEIVIIRNLEEESWLNYCKRLLGNENAVYDNDTIIIFFEDETITDTKSEYVDKQFIMGASIDHRKLIGGPISTNIYENFQTSFPSYFNKKDGDLMIFKRPNIANGMHTLNFKSIFKNNPKYLTLTKVSSIYNAIYTSVNNVETFAIVKNNSNEKSPKYSVAYEDIHFDRSDIVYFVEYIFKNTINAK